MFLNPDAVPEGRNPYAATRTATLAGLVLEVRRRGPRVSFMLDDRSGRIEVSMFEEVYQRYRLVANRQPILIIDGVMQRQDGVHSVLASHIEALAGVPRPAQRSHDYR